jgi:hypothetical protein
MIQHILIGVTVAVGLAGLGVAGWSIHRTRRMNRARNREAAQHVVASIERAALIVPGTITASHIHRIKPPQPSIADRIEVLRPKAGDMLVVQIDRPLTDDQRKSIKAMVGPHVPAGVALVVLDAAASVKHVVSPIE